MQNSISVMQHNWHCENKRSSNIIEGIETKYENNFEKLHVIKSLTRYQFKKS